MVGSGGNARWLHAGLIRIMLGMMFLGPIGAVAGAFLACWLVLKIRVLDVPDEQRKSEIQNKAIPTAGGVGVIVAAAIVLAFTQQALVETRLTILYGGVVLAMVLGLIDDLKSMNSTTKLLGQAAIACFIVGFGVNVEVIEPGFGKVRDFGLVGGGVFSILWLLAVTNAVNFMDGANGLSLGMALFACIGFSGAAGLVGEWELMLASAVLAGALVGFLIWNLPGKLFAGDAGALAVGMALGGFSLVLVRARPDLVFVPPILLSPFLVDVILTLIWRWRQRLPLHTAHSDHMYQIVLKAIPLEHWQLSIGHWMIAANCAVLGVAATMIGMEAPAAIFVGVTLLGVFMHIRIRRAAESIAATREVEAEASNLSNS